MPHLPRMVALVTLFRAYMDCRSAIFNPQSEWLFGPYAIQSWWAALHSWPTMSKKERKRWRRYWGRRSPHLILQRIGEVTI